MGLRPGRTAFFAASSPSCPSRSRWQRVLWRLSPAQLGPIVRKAPRWVTEGYATYIEGELTGSGRPHGAFRAAVLRQWALEGTLPPYSALDRRDGYWEGAMAYLVKPFQKSDLVPAIEIALSRYSEISALESEVAGLTDRLETRKSVERAKGELMTKYSMTEPQGGSDPTAFVTRAEKDGDEWVINGWKFFSSNAKTSSFLIVMVVTDPGVLPDLVTVELATGGPQDLKVAGIYADRIAGWHGVPQSAICDELAAHQLRDAARIIRRRVQAQHRDQVDAQVAREGAEFGVQDRQIAVGGQLLELQGLSGTYSEIFLPLHGAHQARNAGYALAAVEAFTGSHQLDVDLVREAFAGTSSPGRLEVVRRSPTVLPSSSSSFAASPTCAASNGVTSCRTGLSGNTSALRGLPRVSGTPCIS